MGALKVREAARELGYEETTIRDMISKKKIVVRRDGWNVRIHEEDNVELFARRRKFLGKATRQAVAA